MPEQQKVDDVIESAIIDKKNLKKVEKSSTALEAEHGQDDEAVVIEAEHGQDDEAVVIEAEHGQDDEAVVK
jgi:hypothetical protein